MTSVAIPAQVITTLSGFADPNEFKAHVLRNIAKGLEDIEVLYNQVLIAIYIRPEKTAGGIWKPQTNTQEDMWQGKVGLVVKLGPNAFEDDENFQFYGQKAAVGDWVVFKVGDAWSVQVGGFPCRLVSDSNIRMKTNDPQLIF